MTQAPSLQSLPDEILLHILSFLDLDAPSTRGKAQGPDLDHLFSKQNWTPLKAWSLASRRWHRIICPLLHSYLRVRFEDIEEFLPWVITYDSLNGKLQEKDAGGDPITPGFCPAPVPPSSEVNDASTDAVTKGKGKTLSPRYYQSTDLDAQAACVSFFSFIRKYEINNANHPVSLVIYTHSELVLSGRNIVECELWNCLFQHLDAQRLVIICPPATMATVTRSRVDLRDHWAFFMPYQRLVLEQPLHLWKGHQNKDEYYDVREKNHQHTSKKYFRSLFHTRLWDSIEYDEGSSLNAYGTYHYFEKDDAVGDPTTYNQRPPCILNESSLSLRTLSHTLRRLTYTAIFPHASHFRSVIDTFCVLQSLRQLSVRLVPDPNDAQSVLGDDDLVNRGNLRIGDCWNEAEWCYQHLVRSMITGDREGSTEHGPRSNIEVLESGDMGVDFFEEQLDGLMQGAEGWEKSGQGVYSRLESVPVREVNPSRDPYLMPHRW